MPGSPAGSCTPAVASPPALRSLPVISGKAPPPRRSPFSASRCETARAGDAPGRRCSYCEAEEVSVMTTAVIGTGGLGSVIARELASGGETLRLSSADNESARRLAAKIGPAAVVAAGNRDALRGADAVVLALRFTVLKGVIDEIADPLTGKLVVVRATRSGPTHTVTSHVSCRKGDLLARLSLGGCRRGRAWPWRLEPCRLISSSPLATGHRAGGPLLRDRRRPSWRGSRAADPDGRLRAGEGRRDRAVGSPRGGRRSS